MAVPLFDNNRKKLLIKTPTTYFIFLFVFLKISLPQVVVGYDQTAVEDSEASALLKWKQSLENQSHAALLSTWRGATSKCKWEGIQCDKYSNSVSGINLPSYGLKGTLHTLSFSLFPNLSTIDINKNSFYGTIPPQIGNLSKLNVLNLSHNSFRGSIPQEIFTLTSLHKLDLLDCILTGAIPNSIGNLSNLSYLDLSLNDFGSYIPNEIGKLNKLEYLAVANNRIIGSIPEETGMLTNLRVIDLSHNSLSGTIPKTIGNMSNLNQLYICNNTHLSGTIPSSLWNMSNLTLLHLYDNNLSGSIPASVGNLANLDQLRLAGNLLSGSIPSTIGNLTKLNKLYLGFSSFSGSIPATIGNLINLIALSLQYNNLSGSVPVTIGNLTSLTILELANNKLYGSIPHGLYNITSWYSLILSDNYLIGHLPPQVCSGGTLRYFATKSNNFDGPVPISLKNCSSIERILLQGNKIEGDIEQDFGVYPKLEYINLSGNKFYGHISPNWGKCPNLLTFIISNNNISGDIPSKLFETKKLGQLHLSSNILKGKLPKEIGNQKSLLEVKINNNHLSGKIPSEIGSLQKLVVLDLGGNMLSGTIPKQVIKLPMLQDLNLSNNKIKGSIPSEFDKSQSLVSLDLSGNLLIGTIPAELGELSKLQWLNLSCNSLSGSIPSSFENSMSSLLSVNISNNKLEGRLPNNQAFLKAPIESLKNNKGLCGRHTGLVPCSINKSKKSHKAILLVLFLILGALLLVFCGMGVSMYIRYRRARKTETKDEDSKDTQSEEVFSIWSHDGKMVFENIIEATNNFDDKYLIGVGGEGSVYKAKLSPDKVVAVKKLHLGVDRGETPHFKAFENEIQALTEIKHRNIIKLYGFCSHSRFSFLVYKFVEGGNLAQMLNNDTQAIAFDWEKRVNVVKGVANALSYMHHDCSPPIIHRDISSKNVLLDLEYEAHLSDFGTAKFLKHDSQTWTTFAGTYGYSAPELSQTMQVTEKCDVFSFGVLCFEILMGKHPADLITSLLSTSTAKMTYNLLLTDVLDQRPPQPTDSTVWGVILIAKLAFSCLSENPSSRPTMDQVCKQLLMRMSQSPLVDQFPLIRLGQLH